GNDPSARNDGVAFDACAATWSSIPPAPISARDRARAVWAPSTGEMIVWGGGMYVPVESDGAAYNPTTRTWRVIARSPLAARSGHSVVWSGTKMIVFGGSNALEGSFRDGATYDPSADAWTLIGK